MGFGIHSAIESKWSLPASDDQSGGVVFSGDVRGDSESNDEDTTLRRTYPFLTGKCPVSPALEGGVEGHNIKEVPYREASPFRAWSFTLEEARGGPRPGILSKR